MSDEEAVQKVVDGAVWEEFCDQLKGTGLRLLENAPADPFDRAEGLRYVARIAANFLDMMTADPQPSRATLQPRDGKIGLANPDYLYCRARLSGQFEYKLRGHLGDTDAIGFGTFSGGVGTKQGLIRDGYIDSSQLVLEPDGTYEILLSTTEQPGNWLPMTDATNSLQIRQTLLDRTRQSGVPVVLEQLGEASLPPPLDPASFARTLGAAGALVGGVVNQFLRWTDEFAAHPHQIRVLPPELQAFAQGDPNTSYHYGYWELAEDEALLIDFRPPECDYWNLQIGNHWVEALDPLHRRTHVHDQSVIAGDDGPVRIVISHRDPAVPNWLDTAGHRRGTIALRWVGAPSLPETRTRVVPVESLSP